MKNLTLTYIKNLITWPHFTFKPLRIEETKFSSSERSWSKSISSSAKREAYWLLGSGISASKKISVHFSRNRNLHGVQCWRTLATHMCVSQLEKLTENCFLFNYLSSFRLENIVQNSITTITYVYLEWIWRS